MVRYLYKLQNTSRINLYFGVAFGLFLVSFIVGILMKDSHVVTNKLNPLLNQNLKAEPSIELFKHILFVNSKLMFLILAGFCTFSTLSVCVLAMNGIAMGYQVSMSIINGISIYKILLLTLPHGILELFSLLLFSAEAFYLTEIFIRYLFNSNGVIYFSYRNFIFRICLATVSTVLAAIVESYITFSFI